uniref:FAD linked oxidase N-terminal domain-containing protein n=1 Tax=Cannabis sativa TaxID=3483 RepID=A0A803NN71_CANSA
MELTDVLRLAIDGQLSLDQADVEMASKDFGLMKRAKPLAVLHPASAEDVARVVRAAYRSSWGLTVSARGEGHSINGQAQTKNGIVIAMSRSSAETSSLCRRDVRGRLGWGAMDTGVNGYPNAWAGSQVMD